MDIFKIHQKKIAVSTLKMNDIGARIMGGMTKEEASDFSRMFTQSSRTFTQSEDVKGVFSINTDGSVKMITPYAHYVPRNIIFLMYLHFDEKE